MQKQPAYVNYFFKGGYVDLWRTVKSTFTYVKYNIIDAAHDIANAWFYLALYFGSAIGGIFTFSYDWEAIGQTFKGLWKLAHGIGKLICILVLTTSICIMFSLLHVVVLAVIMLIAYLLFLIWLGIDALYRGIKKISSNCPNCQEHFSLPVYICPDCGEEHTHLYPSRYGIWKRKCLCGCKLPTTFFNGRGKLEARCPSCGTDVKDGGNHVDVCIPVVGGRSSGKTCFISQAITAIGECAPSLNLEYEYSATDYDDYEQNAQGMEQGYLPDATSDLRLKYYQFYLSPENAKLKNLISLCDVAGEVYSNKDNLGGQIGYKYANAFLMVVDPLSVERFRREMSKSADPVDYGYSNDRLDEVLSMLISTLENMFCITSKDMLKTTVAVVFSKCDAPGIDSLIGKEAVDKYIRSNEVKSRYDVQNIVCEQFLKSYGEANFLNTLKSKFKSVQFFTSSALGHNQDGTPFVSDGVEDPVLWLIDSACASINLKDRWGKKL